MKEELSCCICGELISSYFESHNPYPLGEYPDRCCTGCNEKVVSQRIKELRQKIKDLKIDVDMP